VSVWCVSTQILNVDGVCVDTHHVFSCQSYHVRIVGTCMSPPWKWFWSHLIFRSTCLVLEFPGFMLFVHISIVEWLSSNMLTPWCGDPIFSNILIVWRSDLTDSLTMATRLMTRIEAPGKSGQVRRSRIHFRVYGGLVRGASPCECAVCIYI
jgi:hypothetical protein